jgi:hypothetical protein
MVGQMGKAELNGQRFGMRCQNDHNALTCDLNIDLHVQDDSQET